MTTHADDLGVNRLGADAPRVGVLPSVWSLDTTLDVVGGLRVDEALPVLDAAERDRAEQLLKADARHQYVASHLGLRVLLGAYLGLAPAEVAFIREECPCCGGPHGRPAVAADARHDGGSAPHFSLSHSDGLAYLAFARVPVGVDVEAVPGAAVVAAVLDNLHPAETAELTALAEPDRPQALARVWSRKEACLKATGTGVALGLAEPYVGSAATPAPIPGWTLADLPAPPGFAAALALRTADPTAT
ncbi:4'-phosphopantetheinyl transferase superfamily protein [Streptomyces sp. NBC_00454]|uniref:4'-phosphopantetheinyl transferase family protein n=1 Tax=Streptomyces sp. NBC_00454 TaxID=2975747 RepID=UPI0030DF9350